MSDIRYRVLRTISFMGILNFLVFVVIAIAIGGDAVNGRIVDGHFYVANHGRLTEVSQAVYTYSLWHVRSIFVTHPLAILTGYLAQRERR
ncbi:hypothetical protein [Bradyrhizobium sp. 2TAF24]|uniref:hypothetical protein n=1 Tax=Bradyrhizobium sp. 2TAF24 TaxID=3233011 RepID=UPI003F9235A9